MATWKKVIVSGSTADVANVQNAGIASNQVVVGAGAGANQVGKALTAGQILMGNVSAVPTGTSVSGDATLSNTGVLSIANDKVTSTMLSGSTADTPSSGDLVKVGANGAFTFSPAASTLSAGSGIVIPANNKISASIDDSTINFNGSLQLRVKSGGITTTQLADSTSATSGTTFAKMQHVAANSIVLRDASSEGDLSAKAVADTQLLIGDGDGFTAAALSGDVTMTNAGVVSVASNVGVTGTKFTGSLKGTADSATTAASADALSTNATGTNLTLGGNLIVNGTTTEVRTTNLNIEDSLILLASGSSTSGESDAAKDPGIVFAGSRIGTSTGAVSVNRGSALFVDKVAQRLSVLANGSFASPGVTTLTAGAHIPLMTTGSLTSFDQVGNFKVDASGDLFVYAG